MTKKEAYKIVFYDMIQNGPQMFRGYYNPNPDNPNFSEHFMYGISTAIEFIAGQAEEESELTDPFNAMFVDNMLECERRTND